MEIRSYLLLIIVLFCFSTTSFSQLNQHLCKANEKIVFAFQLKNKKWVSICKEKKEKYIVYRFSTAKKVELQYPTVLDETSWKQFIFGSYERGGGKQNAARSLAFLRFSNNGIPYEIYEEWSSENNKKSCGITLTDSTHKQIDMFGVVKTKKGSLFSLKNNSKINGLLGY